MNIYDITYKYISTSSVKKRHLCETIGEIYYDLDGKVAYRCIEEELTVISKVEAISEDAVKLKYKNCEDLEIKLKFELDTNPFEVLDPNYCKEIRNGFDSFYETKEPVFIREFDKLCSEEVQEKYSKLTKEGKVNYFKTYIPG